MHRARVPLRLQKIIKADETNKKKDVIFMASNVDLSISAMHRICKRAGAERVSESAAKELAQIMQEIGIKIAREGLDYALHAGRKTIKARDIEIAAKDRRLVRIVSLVEVGRQRLEPSQLAREVFVADVLAIRAVDGCERDTGHGGSDQPGAELVLPGKAPLVDRCRLPGENRDAVPCLLAVGQRSIAHVLERRMGEFLVLELEFL